MPIFSRGQWALAYNAAFDGYDVIFPSGYIKPEHDVWPELFKTVTETGEWTDREGVKHTRSYNVIHAIHDHDVYGVEHARIDKKRADYPVLSGEKKRAAYAPFLGLTPKIIENRPLILDWKSDQDIISKQPTLSFDPLAKENKILSSTVPNYDLPMNQWAAQRHYLLMQSKLERS